MHLTRLRMCGFRSAGPDPITLTLEKLTFLLGPNGTGKTAVLHALARLFASGPIMRRVVPSDFHVPYGETLGVGTVRRLWLEAEFAFPELSDDCAAEPTVPPNFAHMRLETANEQPAVRFRLTAEMDEDGEVSETLVYVLKVDEAGEPVRTSEVNRFDRAMIQVHYLPARRDPTDHVSYAATTLLGRLLRSADWSTQRDSVTKLGEQISDALVGNPAVAALGAGLTAQWQSLHTGSYLAKSGLSFVRSEIEGILRYVTIDFAPGHGRPAVDFSLLSDGQMSLLYISLVLTSHAIGRDALAGPGGTFDVERLRPPVFTLLAVEEPENSLTPHYLGRVLTALTGLAGGHDAQVVVATHSPALMRRVEPEQVRYLRLDPQRRTVVATVTMPAATDEAHKFVREALHAYPELYFARLVVLGEGDSEEVVIPRCLRAGGLEADALAISVVPLGGRHVNHFWRLLFGLGIPHVTLLDLDLGRHQGGCGRIKYAVSQLLQYNPSEIPGLDQSVVDDEGAETSEACENTRQQFLDRLEASGVYFANPLDLDFALLQQFPDAYKLEDAERRDPSGEDVAAVLGKTGSMEAYNDGEKALFAAYRRRFQLGSKPAQHLTALASLDDTALSAGMPAVLRRLVKQVSTKLDELPE